MHILVCTGPHSSCCMSMAMHQLCSDHSFSLTCPCFYLYLDCSVYGCTTPAIHQCMQCMLSEASMLRLNFAAGMEGWQRSPFPSTEQWSTLCQLSDSAQLVSRTSTTCWYAFIPVLRSSADLNTVAVVKLTVMTRCETMQWSCWLS